MPTVNPEVLIWARETAGMPIELAARKVGIRQARGMSAAERLAALESGEQVPTRATIVRMAKQYRRPLIAFYMAGPPRRGRRGVDFRTLTAPLSDGTEALVDALVLNVLASQPMVRAALDAEDEDVPVPFVGSHPPRQPSEEASCTSSFICCSATPG